MADKITMEYDLIDLNTWNRREHFNHYLNHVPCSYSLTVPVEITSLQGQRLYPAMIWLLSQTVNQLQEFRTVLTSEGPAIYRSMHPSYTIFHRETHLFSSIWTEFTDDYSAFQIAYENDCAICETATALMPKPNPPENLFCISMIPWVTFSAFNLNIASDGKYLLPIFTMGQKQSDGAKITLPLSIQVHHAVCDGYHIGQFVELLQKAIIEFPSK